MKLFDKYQIVITSWKLVIRNLDTWAMVGKTSAVSSTTDRYQIVVNKLVNIAIIVINTNINTTEDIKAYEYDAAWGTITAKTFTWLSDKNFKCGEFYEGKLVLGWNPAAPWVFYHSKTFWALSLANIYDFSWYNSWSQPIDDGERIIGFVSNTTEFFIIKRNWFHKITWDKDTWAAYAYTVRKETSTWIINPFCIVNVDKDIIYFDGNTIRRLSYEQNIQALSDSAIGEPIEKIFEGLGQSQIDNAFMTYAYPYVKLYLRWNTASDNNFAVLYNVVDKGFSIQTNIEWNIGAYGTYNNKKVSYVWSRYDNTIFKDNVWTDYNGGDITFSWLSKKVNFWDWVNYKLVSQCEFNWNITIWLPVTITIYGDGKEITKRTISTSNPSALSPTTGSSLFGSSPVGSNSTETIMNVTSFEEKIPLYNICKEIEYKIDGIGQWIFELTWATMSYRHVKAYWTH